MTTMFTVRVNLFIGIGCFIFAALISGCSEKEKAVAEEPERGVYQVRINQRVNEGFEVGDSVNEVINNLGQPKDIKIERIRNVHCPNEIVDEIHHLYYDGLSVEIYKAMEGNKELLRTLLVTSNKFKVKLGLNVGATRVEIKQALGSPSNDSGDIWSYVYTDGYPNEVRFYFENGKVTKIEWSYWID